MLTKPKLSTRISEEYSNDKFTAGTEPVYTGARLCMPRWTNSGSCGCHVSRTAPPTCKIGYRTSRADAPLCRHPVFSAARLQNPATNILRSSERHRDTVSRFADCLNYLKKTELCGIHTTLP
jgi:hypothetical protein